MFVASSSESSALVFTNGIGNVPCVTVETVQTRPCGSSYGAHALLSILCFALSFSWFFFVIFAACTSCNFHFPLPSSSSLTLKQFTDSQICPLLHFYLMHPSSLNQLSCACGRWGYSHPKIGDRKLKNPNNTHEMWHIISFRAASKIRIQLWFHI